MDERRELASAPASARLSSAVQAAALTLTRSHDPSQSRP
jgi:hypothetical protein